MSTYGRFTAAAGSLVLNVVVALVLTQAAGAATPPADASVQGSHTYTVYVGNELPASHEICAGGIRTRAIIAVVLGLIV